MSIMNRCRGFTLTELLIGLTIGLIVSAAVLAGFIAVTKNTRETITMVSLNGAVRDAMTYMSREFRRIGYWKLARYAAYPADSLTLSDVTGITETATGASSVFEVFENNGGVTGLQIVAANGVAGVTGYTDANTVSINISSDFDDTSLTEGNWRIISPFDAATIPSITKNASKDCVLYQYDVDGDTQINNSNEQFGIRLTSDTLEQWTSGTYSCTDGTWTALSDPTLVKYTVFDVTLNETTVDIDSTGVGTSMMVIRSLLITLTGQHPSDTSITRTISKQIKIRNNRYVP